MVEYVSVSIRLPVEIHTKLKLMSAVSSKPMNELIIKWVESQKVQIPGYVEADKPKRDKPAKRQKVQTPSADKDEIRKMLIALKDDGATYTEMAEKLNDDGISTLSGKSLWSKSTVANMFREMASEAVKPPETDDN